MSTVVATVEGPGEVEAVPILIRRIAAAAVPDTVPHVPRPIRIKRDRFLKENELEQDVDLTARQSGPDGGVLIVLDADDDCPPKRAATILRRTTHARSDRPIKVVVARTLRALHLRKRLSARSARSVIHRFGSPGAPAISS